MLCRRTQRTPGKPESRCRAFPDNRCLYWRRWAGSFLYKTQRGPVAGESAVLYESIWSEQDEY